MKLKLSMLVVMLTFGWAFSAAAGAIIDTDSDLIPDVFDNCSILPNGPGDLSNQIDNDGDGIGNRCDPDINQDGTVTGADFGLIFACPGCFNAPSDDDLNGDGTVTGLDFGIFVSFFNLPPGPGNTAH